jgi:PIN domain nuclease of toxin-antitoxin system
MLWLFADPKKINPKIRTKLAQPENFVIVSAVSTWEVAIKISIGKLTLPDSQDPGIYLSTSIRRAGLTTMQISPEHTYGVSSLAKHHGDPFDRLLISQAKIEGLTIVTSDRIIAKYDVEAILI